MSRAMRKPAFCIMKTSEFNAYQMRIKLVFSTVKKYRIFSLVTYTIYIFTVAKQWFLGNFGTGTVHFSKYFTRRMFVRNYACCDVNIKDNDVTFWPGISVCKWRLCQFTFFKCWLLAFQSLKYDSKPFPKEHNWKSQIKRETTRDKLGCAFCISVQYKIKRKFTFWGANTKYILSCVVKISAFSLVLFTLEKYDFFSPLNEIYLVFTSKK